GPRPRPAVEQSAQDDGEPEEHLLRIQRLLAVRGPQALAAGTLRLLEPGQQLLAECRETPLQDCRIPRRQERGDLLLELVRLGVSKDWLYRNSGGDTFPRHPCPIAPPLLPPSRAFAQSARQGSQRNRESVSIIRVDAA